MTSKILLAVLLCTACATATHDKSSSDLNQVRRQLEQRYEENKAAFQRGDAAAVMAVRHPDFHTITPDGNVNDRASMAGHTVALIRGVQKWNNQVIAIDRLTVVGDTAVAIVSQYLDRMALRADNQVHHVQTWVTQRETWLRTRNGWLMWRVDSLRNQRRLVDGQPN